jgi:hypothetical protein
MKSSKRTPNYKESHLMQRLFAQAVRHNQHIAVPAKCD